MDYKEQIEMYFELKGIAATSKQSYFRRIQTFIKFIKEKHNKKIEELTLEDVQQYILYLKKVKGLSPGTINNYISGIRFFYTYVLDKEWDVKKVPIMKRVNKFPVIPPKEDVLTILEEITNLKHKAILILIYGSGLRVSEVAKLKISDICSKSMRIRVEYAKHNTNRYTILSDTGLKVLRQYFKEYFSSDYTIEDWLFPGQKKGTHIHVKTIKNTIIKLRKRLHLNEKISAHTLRHCFATHALEDGVDPVLIPDLRTVKCILHPNIELF